MSDPLAEYRAFQKAFLAKAGYKAGPHNAKGAYAALVAQASAEWHESKGTTKAVKKPVANPRPKTGKALSARFDDYCAGLAQESCVARKPSCKWMGGKVNKCARNTGQNVVDTTAALALQSAWRGRAARTTAAALRAKAQAGQAGGYWW